MFLGILGYEVCDGVSIDVDYEPKKVFHIEVAMPGDENVGSSWGS